MTHFLQKRSLALAGVGVVVLLAVSSLQEYSSRDWRGGPASFDAILFAQSIGVTVWALLAFFAIRVVSLSSDFWRIGARRTTLIHGGLALTLPVAQSLVVSILFASYYYGFSTLAIWDVFNDRMHKDYLVGVLVYLVASSLISSLPKVRSVPTERVVDELGPERYVRRILIKADGRAAVLPVDEIDWIEANDNNLIIHVGRAAHVIRGPLARVAARLDPASFARVHRSTVLNLERVQEVQQWFHGDFVAILKDKTKVTIGRTYRDGFFAALEG